MGCWTLFLLKECWALVFCLPNFKLAQKMVTLFILVTVKHCSDLALLYIANQHLFQHQAAIFIPTSGSKMHWPGHLYPVFYLKAYLCVLSLLGQHCIDFVWPLCSWVTIGSTYQYVLGWFLLGYGKFSAWLRHICLWDAAVSAALVARVPWYPSCR